MVTKGNIYRMRFLTVKILCFLFNNIAIFAATKPEKCHYAILF